MLHPIHEPNFFFLLIVLMHSSDCVEIIANNQGNCTDPNSFLFDNERLSSDAAKKQVAMYPIQHSDVKFP